MAIDRIWKIVLVTHAAKQTILVPDQYVFMKSAVDRAGKLALWFAVDSRAPKRTLEIILVVTGEPVPHVGSYLGTLLHGAVTWHIFTGPGASSNAITEFHYLTKENGLG